MPRLSEKDKEALCASEPVADRPACKLEYDLFADYQDAKKAGTFTGDFNSFKKDQGTGVITWGSKNGAAKPVSLEEHYKTEAQRIAKRTKVILGIGAGLGILVLIAVIVAAKRKK